MLRNSLYLSLIVAAGLVSGALAQDLMVEEEITTYNAETGTALQDDLETVVEGEGGDPDVLFDEAAVESEELVNPMAEAANADASPAPESAEPSQETQETTEASPEATEAAPVDKAADTPDETAGETVADAAADAAPTDEAASATNSHFVSVPLSETQTSLSVKLGQVVEVVLDNPKDRTWNYDKATKFLKILDTLQTDGKFKITYEVINVGVDRLYYDLIDNNGGKFVVIESKFLDIKSEN